MIAMLCACSSGNKEEGPAKTELELVTTLDQAILALSTGKCDAVALDSTTAQNYVDQSNGQFAMSGVKFDLTMYGDYEGNELQLPALFIVDRDKKVIHAHYGRDIMDMPSVDELVEMI